MTTRWQDLRRLTDNFATLYTLLIDAACYFLMCLRPSMALAAENLFLRKQLALYQERKVIPRRTTHATRLALVWLGCWFDWCHALAIVQPATFIRWHRQGFRLFWWVKSHPGRPRIPVELQALIRQIARDNLTWGEERIAHEFLLKLGLRVSPRTVRKYMPKRREHGRGTRATSQRWRTFVRNHTRAIVACDFCVVITATFRLLYVFVVMEHATRRILHVNVTAHPTAVWTLQQLREAIPAERHTAITKHARKINHIARFNNTLRQRLARLVRDTLSFSKEVEHHIGAIKFFICHYNLEKVGALPV